MPEPYSLIQQQIDYYRARATEYDEWFLRQGRYDRGAELNRQWFAEVEQVRGLLAAFHPAGRVLELACGTGLWTQQLLKTAGTITALDASPEVIALNRQRINSDRVTYQLADIFAWQPVDTFDVIFFSFWLSHVPADHFDPFWAMLKRGLKPGGRVFFIDSRYEPTSTARDHILGGRQAETMNRRLNDGREFQIVKVFYQPDKLVARLSESGWAIKAAETQSYFIYGSGGLVNLS